MRGGSLPLDTLADSPRNYPGLRLWLRADLGVTLVGSGVAALRDYSGNNADAVQASVPNQPIWGANSGPNGTPGMTFAGAQSLLSSLFDPLASPQIDVFAVVIPGNAFGFMWDNTNSNANLNNTFRGSFVSAGFNSFRGDSFGGGTNNAWRTTNPIVLNTPHIVECQYDRTVATEQVKWLVDGIFGPQTMVIDSNVPPPFAASPMSIGAFANNTLAYVGVLSEVFFYNRLVNAQERSNLLRYMGTRSQIVVP